MASNIDKYPISPLVAAGRSSFYIDTWDLITNFRRQGKRNGVPGDEVSASLIRMMLMGT